MTLYEILNLDMDSSAEEIRDTYSRLLAQYSREAASGDRASAEKKIADLKYTKKILLDPNERKIYDAALQADLSANGTLVKVSLEKRPVHQNTVTANVVEQDILPQSPPVLPNAQPVVIEEKSYQANSASKLSTGYIITNAVVFTILVIAIVVLNVVIKI